jgi:predicted phage baseplate assembly protein
VSCSGGQDCTCGCCAGTSVQTPRGESNPPGLSAIAYRTGTWATFTESMLARLSSADYPALAPLTTRSDDDFSIGLLDATAVVLDILTFYQERLANESYLRTATQLDSLTQLSRLIGYQPGPGLSASTYVAFTLKAATGLPTDPTTTAITIPAGTQVQSVPGQGGLPQSFETSNDILAKPDWNAMPVLTGGPWRPRRHDTSVYLAGTATQLQPGDLILVVGNERITDPTSERWDVRAVSSVEADTTDGRTLVEWSEGLGGAGTPSSENPKLYALRQRAAFFGYNAVDPRMLAAKTVKALQNDNLVDSGDEWEFGNDYATSNNFASEQLVDLDSVYSKLSPGGWLAVIAPDAQTSRTPSGFISLYLIQAVTTIARSDYGLSAKITRVATDTGNELDSYYATTRSNLVVTQSEELPAAEQPLDHPLYGTFLDLEIIRSDLAGISAVAVTGKSQKLTVNAGVVNLTFVPDDGTAKVPLHEADTITVLQPPSLPAGDGSIPNWRTATGQLTLVIADDQGRSGTVSAALSDFTLAATAKSDPIVQEFALVQGVSVVADPFPHTRILLSSPLLNCYDRTTAQVNANVAPATAGRSVAEILGSGSAATPNQKFALGQWPLTFVQSPTASGRADTLSVKADGVAWTEVPSLYGQPATARVFTVLDGPGGKAVVYFGDNVEGATLPTGDHNIVASYRVGLGADGNVPAGAITTLVDRPLGVSGVVNPLPATGGQDADSVNDVRAKAPTTVLTLGRAVSIVDYQNLAASFAGIAKASAFWIPAGAYRGVFITVAGAGGAALPPGNPALANLVTAFKNYGNPNAAIYASSFLETTFQLAASVAYDPARDATVVQAAVRSLLTTTYSFASRTFGQGVSGDEVAALIQGVPGVVAVNVTTLSVVATSNAGDIGSLSYSVSAYNNWLAGEIDQTKLSRPSAGPNRICPYIPAATPGVLPLPAEILVLDPDPKSLVLGTMT